MFQNVCVVFNEEVELKEEILVKKLNFQVLVLVQFLSNRVLVFNFFFMEFIFVKIIDEFLVVK